LWGAAKESQSRIVAITKGFRGLSGVTEYALSAKERAINFRGGFQ
jgi:hypothetical protein